MRKPLYTVITADIIGSKKYFNHPEQVLLLESKIKNLNEELGSKLILRFSLSRGDELQSIAPSPQDLLQILRKLRYTVYPLSLRVGVGIGEIPLPFNSDNSWDLNGEAFHFARAALEALSGKRGIRTRLTAADKTMELVLNPLLNLVDVVQERWTREQWEAVHQYERYGTMVKAAKEIGIAVQNVEKRCTAAHWNVLKDVENQIASFFRLYFDEKGRENHPCKG